MAVMMIAQYLSIYSHWHHYHLKMLHQKNGIICAPKNWAPGTKSGSGAWFAKNRDCEHSWILNFRKDGKIAKAHHKQEQHHQGNKLSHCSVGSESAAAICKDFTLQFALDLCNTICCKVGPSLQYSSPLLFIVRRNSNFYHKTTFITNKFDHLITFIKSWILLVNNVFHLMNSITRLFYPAWRARVLRVLEQLLADGVLTVGWRTWLNGIIIPPHILR